MNMIYICISSPSINTPIQSLRVPNTMCKHAAENSAALKSTGDTRLSFKRAEVRKRKSEI